MRNGLRLTLYLLAAGMLAASVPALAATGFDNQGVYMFVDSDEVGNPNAPTYNFEDISSTGTAVTLIDDQVSGALPIGFAFTYYGATFTNFYISSNGFITLPANTNSGCCSGRVLPNTSYPGMIAGYWTDLYPPGAGSIR